MSQGMSHSQAIDAAESHTSMFGKAEGGLIPQVPEEFLEDLKRREYHKFLDKYRRFQEDYERRKDLAPTQEVADGGRIGLMYGGDPGFAFEYGGSWADWHDQHRNAMPIEDYIQTKLPKERLPFREPFAGGGMTRRMFLKLMSGLAALPFVGKGVQKASVWINCQVEYPRTAGSGWKGLRPWAITKNAESCPTNSIINNTNIIIGSQFSTKSPSTDGTERNLGFPTVIVLQFGILETNE